MIDYQSGFWNISFVFQLNGSVFPKALMVAIPSGVICGVFNAWILEYSPSVGTSQVWAAYNFVLGFLIIFRTQQAYQRFWEGASLLSQARGEWFHAISSCFAFCSSDPQKDEAVTKFQHMLVRMASLLYCCTLQQIAVMSDETFEVLDLDGISEDSLMHLAASPDKVLVLLQWIQRAVVLAAEDGILSAPPPILSRVYQELSAGIVHVTNTQKITDIPFPFPYAQMVTTMLLLSTVAAPIINAMLISNVIVCTCLTFVSVFAMWCINYIAAEIEMPFGEDPNDLPVSNLQDGFNVTLQMLLEEATQRPPEFKCRRDLKDWVSTMKCPFELITNDDSRVWVTSFVQRRVAKAYKTQESLALSSAATLRSWKSDSEVAVGSGSVKSSMDASVMSEKGREVGALHSWNTSSEVAAGSGSEKNSMDASIRSERRGREAGRSYVSFALTPVSHSSPRALDMDNTVSNAESNASHPSFPLVRNRRSQEDMKKQTERLRSMIAEHKKSLMVGQSQSTKSSSKGQRTPTQTPPSQCASRLTGNCSQSLSLPTKAINIIGSSENHRTTSAFYLPDIPSVDCSNQRLRCDVDEGILEGVSKGCLDQPLKPPPSMGLG